jgi:regulator of protease activity HflC (stomatin/prohibitin superfamily)
MLGRVNILAHERGLVFEDGIFTGTLNPGKHWAFGKRVEKANLRETWFKHADLDVIAASVHAPKDLKFVRVAEYERAFVWVDGRLDRVLKAGLYALWTSLHAVNVTVYDVRDAVCKGPVCSSRELEEAVRTFGLADEARILDLKDHERALVWVDGRFTRALKPGLHVLWITHHEVRTEVVDARSVRVEHPELLTILQSPGVADVMSYFAVEPGHVGLWYSDGDFKGELKPGMYGFWLGVGRVKLLDVEQRERTLDISGQDIMTADKVTLRLNAVLTWRVTDALKSVSITDDASQALYREAQLALRAAIGGRELDALLGDKESVATELKGIVAAKAADFGLEVQSLGIRDIILPGEMKDLLNKVTEAKKAAEASLITRREETAAARMQANTAKLLEGNPTLMKLRELEVLEKVAEKANLTVLLGEGGLNERVMKLL